MSSEESAPLFRVGDDVPNAAQIVADIQSIVEQKVANCEYDDARISVAERSNLVNIDTDDDYVRFYLRCLHNGAQVDINAFEIPDNKGGVLGKGMVRIKKTIWSMLKFYTYRMWTQQNTINSTFVSALETTFSRHEEAIQKLETRIAELESELAKAKNPDG